LIAVRTRETFEGKKEGEGRGGEGERRERRSNVGCEPSTGKAAEPFI
jgi:hypothetical protein